MELPKLVSKEVTYDNPYRQIEAWVYTLPNGEEKSYDIIRAKDAALICCLTKDNNIVVLKQYFLNAEGWQYTFPAGMIDDGEDAQKAVVRELLEEAGATVEEVVSLGSAMRSKWVIGNIHFFLGFGAEIIQDPEHDSSEFIEVETMPIKDVISLFQSGKLQDIGSHACFGHVLPELIKRNIISADDM